MEEAELLDLLKKLLTERPKEEPRQIVNNFYFYGDKMDVGTLTAARLITRALNASQEPDPTPPALTKAKIL